MINPIPDNFELLGSIVGEAKIVCYGESSHGILNEHIFAAEMFKYLAVHKNFRVMLFECSWEIMYKAEQYFNDPDDSNLDYYCNFFLNAFDSGTSRDLLRWIKRFNKENPSDKIIVAGFQPEQCVTDGAGLKEYFARSKVQIPQDIIDLLNKHAFYNGTFKTEMEAILGYFQSVSGKAKHIDAKRRMELLNALARLEYIVEKNKDALAPSFYAKTLCHVKSLIGYFGTINYQVEKLLAVDPNDPYYDIITLDAGKETYTKGDKIRMDIFEIQKQYVYPDKKVMIWQHNFHAAKQSYAAGMVEGGVQIFDDPSRQRNAVPELPIVMSGVWLDGRYGKDFVVVGSVLPKRKETNPDTIDYYFKKRFGNQTVLVDLKNAPQDLPVDKALLLYERSNKGYFKNFVLAKQFDAVLYMPFSERVDFKPIGEDM